MTKTTKNIINFEADAGDGLENMTPRDSQIPVFFILQYESPQAKETSAEYVEDAKAGMIYNTVSKALYDKLDVIPCGYKRVWVEWAANRDDATHPLATYTDATVPDYKWVKRSGTRRGGAITQKGTYVEETCMHYVLALLDSGAERGLIMMSRTQIKESKFWTSLMYSKRLPRADGKGDFMPPRYACVYQLKNQIMREGEYSWYVWKVSDLRMLDIKNPEESKLYLEAKRFSDVTKAETIDPNALTHPEERKLYAAIENIEDTKPPSQPKRAVKKRKAASTLEPPPYVKEEPNTNEDDEMPF